LDEGCFDVGEVCIIDPYNKCVVKNHLNKKYEGREEKVH